ncbi:hypothetical protein CTAYLR_008377 [Chrysophaeum taylorii]|uniref:Non-canonical E2 ubiquitin-conjugating enzyme C-terminal domain-containing protein n=1 Tax=Chrysophaeum taylorii TaxID=2483200 RepID=A0AAD7XR85_9STRA|nr:hypothetical protein CTAYLR_008377 [Chrysophaeum taylorii]
MIESVDRSAKVGEMQSEQHEDSQFVDRCKYMPLRLNGEERKKLGTLIAALKVSEYTDEVDTFSRRAKTYRILDSIRDLCSIATGLAVSANPAKGRALACRDQRENAAFFSELFEIGRRHKIMNPSKMRSEYGKLMYLMQDAQSRAARDGLGFSVVAPLKMVSSFLDDRGKRELLWDARLPVATGWHEDLSLAASERSAVKQRARELLCERWTSADTSANDVALVVDSIDDARCYERFNVAPVDAMLKLLETRFDPRAPTREHPASLSLRRADDPWFSEAPPVGGAPHAASSVNHAAATYNTTTKATSPRRRRRNNNDDDDDGDDGDDDDDLEDDDDEAEDLSLASSRARFRGVGSRLTAGLSRFASGIRDNLGVGGAKLSHSHPTQFTYVRQSLLLWREIMRNMYLLWHEADADLLSTSHGGYQLWNTGQGLQRVQSCPRVAAEMRRILSRAQRESGQPWVGLSVVHLGDRDVPNALIFIDKYTQVPRILAPVALVVDAVDFLCGDEPAVLSYVRDAFGSPRELELTILADFFKRAFDGDGDDGGSCIDGRLTSAWNWCSKISKKNYYNFFSMSGFQGFDGSYKE